VGRVRLFVYGTLTDEAQLTQVTGRRFPRHPARLAGWARVVAGRRYPTIVPRSGAVVDGFLIEDVDPASLRALDAYEDEGRLYRRQAVEVTSRGERVACEVYVGVAPSR